MKDNVDYLPIWKKNSTAEEKFMELASIARKHPKKFEKIIVVYQQDKGDYLETNYAESYGLGLNEALGLLEMCKFEMLKYVYAIE